MDIIKSIEHEQLKNTIPDLHVGDTVRVHQRIKEGNRQRIQVFEGIIIKKQNGGLNETFTVRKESAGIGVKRVLPLNTPKIQSLEVVKKGKVRRVKLNFLDSYVGTYKIKERGRN